MNKKEFIEELREELKNLERLEKEMKTLLTNLKNKPTFMEIRTSASILHDFYSGIERIFEKIAIVIDKNLPKGETSHIDLLIQMTKPYGNIRPKIITETLFEKLKEYLKFRHLFRHIYGFELKWDRIKPLCLKMENILEELNNEIDKFLKNLNKE